MMKVDNGKKNFLHKKIKQKINMENLPIVVFVTNQECPPCKNLRGDGRVSLTSSSKFPTLPGGNKWDVNFFTKLLTNGGTEQKINAIELHFSGFNITDIKNINEYSEFSILNEKEKTYVIRKNYINNGKNTKMITEKNGLKIAANIINETFDVFLSKKVSKELYKFVGQFPAWFFIDYNVWNNSINNNDPLFLYSNAFPIIKNSAGNNYIIDRNNKVEMEDPVAIVNKILNNELILIPQKEEKPKTEKIEYLNTGVNSINYRLVPFKNKNKFQ